MPSKSAYPFDTARGSASCPASHIRPGNYLCFSGDISTCAYGGSYGLIRDVDWARGTMTVLMLHDMETCTLGLSPEALRSTHPATAEMAQRFMENTLNALREHYRSLHTESVAALSRFSAYQSVFNSGRLHAVIEPEMIERRAAPGA